MTFKQALLAYFQGVLFAAAVLTIAAIATGVLR